MILGYPPFWDDSPIKIYEKIVTGRISFPVWLQKDARDIVQRLCTRDLSSRLGNMRGGGYEVMRHPFFTGIDWRVLESRVHDVRLTFRRLTFPRTSESDKRVTDVYRVRWCLSCGFLRILAISRRTTHRDLQRTKSTPTACLTSMTMCLKISDLLFWGVFFWLLIGTGVFGVVDGVFELSVLDSEGGAERSACMYYITENFTCNLQHKLPHDRLEYQSFPKEAHGLPHISAITERLFFGSLLWSSARCLLWYLPISIARYSSPPSPPAKPASPPTMSSIMRRGIPAVMFKRRVLGFARRGILTLSYATGPTEVFTPAPAPLLLSAKTHPAPPPAPAAKPNPRLPPRQHSAYPRRPHRVPTPRSLPLTAVMINSLPASSPATKTSVSRILHSTPHPPPSHMVSSSKASNAAPASASCSATPPNLRSLRMRCSSWGLCWYR